MDKNNVEDIRDSVMSVPNGFYFGRDNCGISRFMLVMSTNIYVLNPYYDEIEDQYVYDWDNVEVYINQNVEIRDGILSPIFIKFDKSRMNSIGVDYRVRENANLLLRVINSPMFNSGFDIDKMISDNIDIDQFIKGQILSWKLSQIDAEKAYLINVIEERFEKIRELVKEYGGLNVSRYVLR